MTHHDPNAPHPPIDQVDPWHTHTPDEGVPQEEHGARANPVLIGGALAATLIFLVVVIVVIFMYFETFVTRLRIERVETTDLAARQIQYKRDAAENLATHSVLPASVAPEGVVTIPKPEAMRRVIRQYGEQR
jgi:hypothetical protein